MTINTSSYQVTSISDQVLRRQKHAQLHIQNKNNSVSVSIAGAQIIIQVQHHLAINSDNSDSTGPDPGSGPLSSSITLVRSPNIF